MVKEVQIKDSNGNNISPICAMEDISSMVSLTVGDFKIQDDTPIRAYRIGNFVQLRLAIELVNPMNINDGWAISVINGVKPVCDVSSIFNYSGNVITVIWSTSGELKLRNTKGNSTELSPRNSGVFSVASICTFD